MSVLPSCCGSFTALESKHHVADGSPHQLVAAAHPVPKESQRPSTTKAEWDGRTTTVFRAACFGPDPQALAAHETEVWGAWMHQHFPSQPTTVGASGT